MQHLPLNRRAPSMHGGTQVGFVSIEVLVLGTTVAYLALSVAFGVDVRVLFNAIVG